MVIVQMLQVSRAITPQKNVQSRSFVWKLYVQTFCQLCHLLGMDDRTRGADWFGLVGPDGSLAVVNQPAMMVNRQPTWAEIWQVRLQVIYDLVQAMATCGKKSARDEYYFRWRSAQLIKFGIKVVEMIEQNV